LPDYRKYNARSSTDAAKGRIERGKVATISKWCYLIAILLEQLKNVEIKI